MVEAAMSDPACELEKLRAELAATKAELAQARAVVSTSEAMIAGLKLEIALLRREHYGRSAERTARLIDQLELQLEELVTDAAEDRVRAEKTTKVAAFERRKPVRKPFPEHLPRERVVVPAPTSCECCGSERIVKMGEDITETLEVVPRQWKVIQTVREKFTCRVCEKISQVPAPFHPVPRGWAGPSLLAMIVFEKFGQHQPLNRQAERYAREGVDLSLSTLADQIGAVAELLKPLHDLIEAHVLAASRLHGDDTTVPLLARGGTKTARLWTYVRDDRPFGGTAPPAVVFRFSRDRAEEHPAEHLKGWHGILQADAYAGYTRALRAFIPSIRPLDGSIPSGPAFTQTMLPLFSRLSISTNPLPFRTWSPFAPEIIQRLSYTLTVSSGSSLYNRDVVLTVPDEDPALRGAGLPSPEADLPGYDLEGDEPGRGVCRGSSRRLSAPQCLHALRLAATFGTRETFRRCLAPRAVTVIGDLRPDEIRPPSDLLRLGLLPPGYWIHSRAD